MKLINSKNKTILLRLFFDGNKNKELGINVNTDPLKLGLLGHYLLVQIDSSVTINSFMKEIRIIWKPVH